ncbi:MAG: hypothetical protein V1851_03085 [Patescibacteria group bacterium]
MEYEYRISKTSFYLMLGTAIFFDLIQAGLDIIPVLGWILSSFVALIAFLTFWLWLKIKKVGIFDRGLRMIMLWIITPFIEATFSFIPGLTFMIISTYFIVKADDELDKKGILSKEKQEKLGKILSKKGNSFKKIHEEYA